MEIKRHRSKILSYIGTFKERDNPSNRTGSPNFFVSSFKGLVISGKNVNGIGRIIHSKTGIKPKKFKGRKR